MVSGDSSWVADHREMLLRVAAKRRKLEPPAAPTGAQPPQSRSTAAEHSSAAGLSGVAAGRASAATVDEPGGEVARLLRPDAALLGRAAALLGREPRELLAAYRQIEIALWRELGQQALIVWSSGRGR
jgi:hypothetical protein